MIIRKFYKEHQDEHLMIKNDFKNLLLSKNRIDAITQAVNKGFDLAILDDGFQDYRIKKNLNIICFNQRQQIGNGMVIPSGPLRESMASLERVDIVVINGRYNKNFEEKILRFNKNILIFYSSYVPLNINKFKKKKLLALAGIGNPENFIELLHENNLEIAKKKIYPDHYEFKKGEILDIIKEANDKNYKIIMTEKDFYKIEKYNFKEINYLKVKLEIKNKEQLINKIISNAYETD